MYNPQQESSYDYGWKKSKRCKIEKPVSESPYENDKDIQNILETLKSIENDLKELGNNKLQKRLNELHGHVEVVFQKQNEEKKTFRSEIQSLKKEVENLKEEKGALEKKLAVSQVTWVWEAHVARFVVDRSKNIYEFGRFGQMTDYIKGKEFNYWDEIQDKLSTSWTKEHWDVINDVRAERNGIAHPSFIDLDDLVQSEFKKMSVSYRKRMGEMLDMLKMTASLMKFGRLAAFYKKNKHLFWTPRLVRNERMDRNALRNIVSWDRNFEEIDGLQMIKHEDAKLYPKRYVGESANISNYFSIVDFIKDGNSKRLGKLAWKYTELFSPTETSPEYEALQKLMELLPNPNDEINIADSDIAMLHIPDFLPNNLWKVSVKIVKKLF